jgi:hypothetical protein
MRKSIIAILVALSATLSSGVQASTSRLILTVWSARATNYRQQHALAHAQLKLLAITAAASVREAKPTVAEDIEMFLNAINGASERAGRGRLVFAFTEFMRGKPDPAVVDRWILEQADVLKARLDGLEAFEAHASKTIDYSAASPSERLRALEAVAIERGEILGTIAEMGLMHKIVRVIFKQWPELSLRSL